MDENRKAFEEWAVAEGYALDQEPDEKGGVVYVDMFLEVAWRSWQARDARTEAKVSGEVVSNSLDRLAHFKLPPIHDDAPEIGYETARDILETLQLPAPQSPVVPGVEELKRVYLDGFDYGSELDPVDDGIKRIHAHLLANARESREDRYRKVSPEDYRFWYSRTDGHSELKFARSCGESTKAGAERACGFWGGYETAMKALATVGKDE